MRWLKYLTDKALQTPTLFFLTFCGFHVALWVLVPTFTQPNAHLDVIECLAWGHEWQWGYAKHPPFHAWLTELFFMPFGKHIWPGFLLSQVHVVLTFLALWKLTNPLLGKQRSLMAILLLEGIYYFNFTSPEFNSNVSLLPLWAWASYFFFRSLKCNRFGDWLAFGVLCGFGMLSKYTSGILLIVFLAFMLIEPQARQRFRSFGPYLALLITLCVLTPHIVWLYEHNFPTLFYFLGRSSASQRVLWGHLLYPLDFAWSHLLILLPFFSLLFSLGKALTRREFLSATQETPSIAPWEKRLLAYLCWGPILVTLALSALGGFKLRTMWGTPLFIFAGAYAVAYFLPYLSLNTAQRVITGSLSFLLFSSFVYGALNIGQPYILKEAKRAHFPGLLLAHSVTTQWRHITRHPLQYVIGEIWEAGNIGFYSQDRPSVMIDGDVTISPWVDKKNLKSAGAVIVWTQHSDTLAMPAVYAQRFPEARIQPPLKLALQTGANLPPVIIGWAIIPPRSPVQPHPHI